MEEEEIQKSVEKDFQAYVRPFTMITWFKYLRRVLTEAGDNWKAVVGNFQKARKSWARIVRIPGR